MVLNVDGLEWQRAKWNAIGRAYYRVCAWPAARLPIHVVTDARVIQPLPGGATGARSTSSRTGPTSSRSPDDGTLARLGLEAGRYVLYVSRLEPENNAHVVIEAMAKVAERPATRHRRRRPVRIGLHRAAPRDRRSAGPLHGCHLRRRATGILQSHATLYVQATEVGGTHPALVEAMGHGSAIVANDVPEHRETLGDAGRFYTGVDQLATVLGELLDDPAQLRHLRESARSRAERIYSWDAITDSYEAWFRDLSRP